MKISAIISAYYADEFIEARIQNLEEQEVEGGLEIIAVCRKASPEYRLLMMHDNIKILMTDDIPSVYAAWNLAIEQATGEYITNCNSDDILYPGALQALSTALDEHKAYAVAYFDWDRVKEHGKAPIGQFLFAEGGFDTLMKGCFVGPGPMWRKSLHEKYGLFDPEFTSAGDYEFWLRLAYNGVKFYHVRSKKTFGAHLERDEGLEHRSPVKTIWETARARARYRKEVVPHDER